MNFATIEVYLLIDILKKNGESQSFLTQIMTESLSIRRLFFFAPMSSEFRFSVRLNKSINEILEGIKF